MIQRKTLSDKTKNNLLKIWKFQGRERGREGGGGEWHQTTPWNRNSKEVEGHRKNIPGWYGHFLEQHNVVNSILCLNLLLLIMNHMT